MTENLPEPSVPLDPEVIKRLQPSIDAWHQETRELLPSLPEKLDIFWVGGGVLLIRDVGVGGLAYSKELVTLVFDPDFPDKETQLKNFKGTYFHESYHVAQGFVETALPAGATTPVMMNAILEGAATVFERERAGTDPIWGKYPEREAALVWLAEVKQLPVDYDEHAWKFYHPEKQERHILYKVGTFIVDEALARSGKQIEELATVPWQEILELSGL